MLAHHLSLPSLHHDLQMILSLVLSGQEFGDILFIKGFDCFTQLLFEDLIGVDDISGIGGGGCVNEG